MDSIEHLRELYAYNDWANRRCVAAVRASAEPKAHAILAHLLTTEAEYFERLHGKDSTGFDFWPQLSIDECSELARAIAERFEKLLGRFDDEGLGLRANYRTSEGIAHENTFREMLSHVLIHSATHRGSIAAALRAAGIAPPQVDYIIYLRENG